MNIIADVAGNHDALVRLLAKMPQEKTVFLGDLIDRGPKSAQVLDLVGNMVAQGHVALMGNHEHMFLDHCRAEPKNKLYQPGIWFTNGGDFTLYSYGLQIHEGYRVNPDHMVLIANMPLFYTEPGLFLSHAPWFAGSYLKNATIVQKFKNINGDSLIWNRRPPRKRRRLQIFGHNAHWGLTYFNDRGHHFQDDPVNPWAICIDQSHHMILTGMHYPTMTIYTEPY